MDMTRKSNLAFRRGSSFGAGLFVLTISAVLSTVGGGALHADESFVINEVLITPDANGKQFIEFLNRGESDLDLFSWWICHQPSSRYFRLLQVPQGVGTPMTDSIVLGPGDFLVTTWSLEEAGGYTTRPNSAGTTTHEVNINVNVPVFLFDAAAGNLSVWDQVFPDFPSFGEPASIRDYVGWGVGGTYVGGKRGCTAYAAGLWPAPILSDCSDTTNVVLTAVDTASLMPEDNRSIQYNQGSDNAPTDYFIAPATPGEPNILPEMCVPGDINGDGAIDGRDIQVFSAVWIGLDTDPMHLCSADTFADGVIDCLDRSVFVMDLGAAGCVPGDANGDGAANGRDIAVLVEALFDSSCPTATMLCALDANDDLAIDESDIAGFVGAILEALP